MKGCVNVIQETLLTALQKGSPSLIFPQYLHSRLCSLLENNGVSERDMDCQEYWKGRLSDGDLSSLSISDEAISLVFEVIS